MRGEFDTKPDSPSETCRRCRDIVPLWEMMNHEHYGSCCPACYIVLDKRWKAIQVRMSDARRIRKKDTSRERGLAVVRNVRKVVKHIGYNDKRR